MRAAFSLDDLRLVREIGAAGTLTGAARRLRIDHSTAFRRLGAVERRVGARLFERSRDGYTPTSAGEAAVASATRILEELGDLEHRLAGEDLRPSGIVRLTTTDTLLDLVGPMLAGLRADHPRITVELVVASSFFTLTKRDADVALRPAVEAPEALVGQRLAGIATAPYAKPEYLARQPRRAALSSHDWVGFEESLGHLRSAKWVGANVSSERIVHRANSMLALRGAARAGMGVAALPFYLGDPDSELRRVHAPLAELETSLWLLTHPDLRRVARIRTVIDYLRRRFAKERALLEGERPGLTFIR